MTDTLVVIMAHAEAQATFDRHMPLWKAHRCDTIVFCPADAPVYTGLNMFTWGHRSHHGAEANRRFKRLIAFLAGMAYEGVWIFEYDAFCLSPELPRFKASPYAYVIAANCFYDDGKRFQGSLFTHPPIYANQQALRALDTSLRLLPDDVNEGFWDRMLGLAIENAKILPFDFLSSGYGYAQNTIEHGHNFEAQCASAEGAILFHGVKDQNALWIIQQGHEEAKRNGKLRPLEIAV